MTGEDDQAGAPADPVPATPACDAPASTARQRWGRRAIGLGLALLAFVLVVHNQHDVGIARDETTYMDAGSRYADWWLDRLHWKAYPPLPRPAPLLVQKGAPRTPRQVSITRAFGGDNGGANNPEHPPLVKTLMGLSEKLFHDQLGVAGELTAYRLPGAALNALLVFVVFALTLGVWGLAEAVVAALLVTFLPRALFHAGLGCFDAPIAALWFVTIYAYWRALASRRWSWVAGLTFGLALATKHNALLLPFAIGAHYVWVSITRWRRARRLPEMHTVVLTTDQAARPELATSRPAWWSRARLRANADRLTGALGPRPSVIVALIVIAPLTLLALWPWLWFDTIDHISRWIGFHLHHTHYNFEYLGHNWNAPPFPWHVALVTTLFTVPVVTLAAAAIGTGVIAVRARRGEAADVERAPGLLLLLSAGASIGPFLLGSTPIFGAEKHWMPAIPSLCVVAGVGVIWAARAVVRVVAARVPWVAARRLRMCQLTCAVLGVVVVGAAAIETFHAQPYALTSYNALAGGAPGGADKGMNRQFWGVSARGVLPYLRAHAPRTGEPAAPVYSHDASMAWGVYRHLGLLPPTLPDSGHEAEGVRASQWALVIHELHFNRHDYLIWDAYGTVAPVFVLRMDGVPIVSVYRRPGSH